MNNIYLIGYTGESCPKCGRVRIEKWSDGLRICEKCGFCVEENSYHDRDKDFEEAKEGDENG